MTTTLHFPREDALKLEPHLPPKRCKGNLGSTSLASDESTAISGSASEASLGRPFVTLTFATSLDSSLSLAPGMQTVLSGPQSKAMTHFLRSHHDAICVGAGTAIADNPGLNCRLDTSTMDNQPRPIIIDPRGRWQFSANSNVFKLAREKLGLAPFIITAVRNPPEANRQLLEEYGGKYIFLAPSRESSQEQGGETSLRFGWADILRTVKAEGLQSLMIEGGGQIINSLLDPSNSELVDAVIVTIAPTWLGRGGVVVAPKRVHDSSGQPIPALRLSGVSWHQLGDDVVLCGKIK